MQDNEDLPIGAGRRPSKETRGFGRIPLVRLQTTVENLSANDDDDDEFEDIDDDDDDDDDIGYDGYLDEATHHARNTNEMRKVGAFCVLRDKQMLLLLLLLFLLVLLLLYAGESNPV